MGRKSKRIVAILLSLLMVFSVCSPITGGGGLGSSRAKAGNTEQTATATDAITYGKSGSPVKTYANPEGLTLSDFTITVNGQKVTNDSAVKNGDEVQIKFNWAIANNSHVSEFEVDLKAQGITVNDYQESVLYDSSSRAVGTWKIENGRFYITLDSQFTAESNIDGGGNIKGRVDFSADDLDENNKGKFEIGDASFTIDVDLNQTESSAWAWKNAGTATVNDDGTVTQSYSLGVEAQNGTVTLGEATETLGTALGQMSNIKVGGTSYSTWEEAKAALNGMKLDSTSEDTKRVEITYDVNISAENAKQAFKNGNTTIFNNQFNIDYKTSKDNPKDAGASTTGINIARPSVSKNGAWNTDASGNKETVTWTITVTLGDLTKFSDFDADSVKIADALGEYLTAADLPAGVDLSNLTLQDFTESNGTYIFSYTTSVADEALNSTFPVTLTNKADVDFGDDITYGSSASVTTDGTGIIEKEFDHINEDGTLAWKVFIHVPESDTITEVVLGDWDNPTYPFTQTMDTTVVVDGSTVFDNGTWISNTMVSNSSRAESGNIELRFNDEYVASKKGATIEIAVSTKPQNLSDGAIYRNHANLSYKDASGNSYTKSTDATYEYTNSLNKTGKVSTEKLNTVEYTLDVNLSSVASLSAGDSITVVDTLPENMVFNADGVLNYRKWVNDYYSYDDTSLTGELGVAIENNKVTFTIPVSSAVLSAVEEAASGSAGYTKVFARIIYTASLSDDALKDYVAEGKEIEVTNNAEVLYDGDVIGKDSSTNKLTPEKMVTKGGTYNVEKKAAEYTIYVNPNAADLSDADIIAAEDTFGEALIFRKDTLKIQEYTGSKNPLQDSQNWKDLSNYSYTYDSDTRTLKLSLPDSKALKITYEAYINQEIGGALNAANSTNSFRLVGYTGNDDSSSTNFSTTVQEPSVWAHSDTGSITLYKYWTNENNQLVALNGSTFALYECKRDGTNSWTQELEEEPVKKGITLDGTGTVIIKELAYDKVYALVETGADDGFQINKEPYYFMICDTGSTATVPEWADKYFYSGFLYYENEPDTQERGSLTISKKVEGYTFAAGKTFDVTVKDADGNYVDKDGNVSTDKAVIEIPAGGSVTINNIPVGDYTVSEETEGTAVAGYDLEVTVNNEGKVTITKDTTATAEVTNTYTQDKGSLTISKKVEGYTFAAGKTFDVTVTNAAGKYVSADGAFSDTKVTIAVPANGNITIKDIPVGTYTVSEDKTGAAVTNYGLVVSGEGDVTVTKDTTATAAITNTYTQDKGSLTISKKVEGYTFASGKTFDVTVTNAAGKYVSADGAFSDTKVTIAVPANGSVSINDIPVGTYTVSEDQAGAAVTNYGLVVSGEGDVTVTKDTTATAAITNTYTQDKGSLTISKKVEGYTFDANKTFNVTVTNEAGKYVSENGAFSDTKVTIAVPANGGVAINDIPVGTYTVSEDRAGTAVEGYELVVSGEGDVEVTNGGTATATITNTYTSKLGKIRFTKVGRVNETCSADKDAVEALEGVVFALYKEDGTTAVTDTKGDAVTATSNSNGIVEFTGLAIGTYVVKEVSSVDNYIVDTNSYKATITAENVDTYAALEDVTGNKLVNDKHRTDISLVKVNESDTSEKLPDATYGLYKTENNVEVEVATAKTDSDGILTFTGVFTDTEYTIKELVSPNGSYVSENPIKIEYGVKEDGTIEITHFDGGVNTENGSATAIVKDGQITWLEPSVKYSFVKENEAGEKLAGAVLKIVDSEGNEVAKWTTDGNAYELNGTLSVGNTYKLVEVSAPSGYEIAADIEFTVANESVSAGENKVVTITMVDKASEVTTEDTTEVTTEDTTEVTTEDTTEITTEDTTEITTEDTGDTTEDTTEVTTTEQTPTTPSDTPQTGDQAPIMPIVILFTMSVAGIVVVVVAKRKNNKQNREN